MTCLGIFCDITETLFGLGPLSRLVHFRFFIATCYIYLHEISLAPCCKIYFLNYAFKRLSATLGLIYLFRFYNILIHVAIVLSSIFFELKKNYKGLQYLYVTHLISSIKIHVFSSSLSYTSIPFLFLCYPLFLCFAFLHSKHAKKMEIILGLVCLH